MAELSYVSGVSSQPLIGRTIGDLFDQTCTDHPDRLALVSRHQDIRWTYAELKDRGGRLRGRPAGAGAGAGATGSASGRRTAPSGRLPSSPRPRPA